MPVYYDFIKAKHLFNYIGHVTHWTKRPETRGDNSWDYANSIQPLIFASHAWNLSPIS